MEKTIGQRIKEYRLKLGMTQQEFSVVMYMPKSTISAYERVAVEQVKVLKALNFKQLKGCAKITKYIKEISAI